MVKGIKRIAPGIWLGILLGAATAGATPPPDTLPSRVAQLEAAAAAVQEQLDSINAAISKLQADLGTEVVTREAQVNQLDGRVTTNESAISENAAHIADHEARITTNESDINANSTLIDDNTNRISALKPSISVKANGTRIGTYVTTISDPSAGRQREVLVMSDSGYIFSICLNSLHCGDTKNEGDLMWPDVGDTVGIGYTTVDCTGQGYLLESQINHFPGVGNLVRGSGYVFDNNGSIYYSPIDNQPIQELGSLRVRSSTGVKGGSCGGPGSSSFSGQLLYPVFPNDPAVTDVSSSSFALPLSLGFN